MQPEPIKVTYQQAESSPGEAERKINAAFDILFAEAAKMMRFVVQNKGSPVTQKPI